MMKATVAVAVAVSLLLVTYFTQTRWVLRRGYPRLRPPFGEDAVHRGIPMSTLSERRRLGAADFQALNLLIQGIRINLPNSDVTNNGLTVHVRNLYCTNVQMDDIAARYTTAANGPQLTMTMSVAWSTTICYADFSWNYLIVRGTGNLKAYTSNNSVNTSILFSTPPNNDFNNTPPTVAVIDACKASVTISKMDIQGSLTTTILSLFKSTITSTVQNEVNAAICDQIHGFNSTLTSGQANLNAKINQTLLAPLAPPLADPLYPQNHAFVPPGVHLVDLQQNATSPFNLTGWIAKALRAADNFLGEIVSAPGGSLPGGKDYNANVWMRKYFLDSRQALTVNTTSLPKNVLPVFTLNASGVAGQLGVEAASVRGLDSLNSLWPLQMIGAETLQKRVAWEYLEVDLVMAVDMTLDLGTMVQNPRPLRVVENLVVSFRLNHVSLMMAIFMAVDLAQLESLMLSAVLRQNDIFACLLSIMYATEVAGLQPIVGEIVNISMQGFANAGIGPIVSVLVDAWHRMFSTTVLKTISSICQVYIRDLLNTQVLANLLRTECPTLSLGPIDSIDFRELLFPPNVSQSLGGAGIQPYGLVGSLVYSSLLTILSETGQEGLPKINELIIRPVTKMQSGVEGELYYDQINLTASSDDSTAWRSLDSGLTLLLDQFDVSIQDLRIQNVDTVINPFSIWAPTTRSSTVANLFSTGGLSSLDPLLVSFQFSVARKRILDLFPPSPPRFDQVQVHVSTQALQQSTLVNATMRTALFMNLTLHKVTQLPCWLSVISPNGFMVASSNTNLTNVQVSIEPCFNCSGDGLLFRQGLFGLSSAVWSRLGARVIDATLTSPSFQSKLNQQVAQAKLSCPSSQYVTCCIDGRSRIVCDVGGGLVSLKFWTGRSQSNGYSNRTRRHSTDRCSGICNFFNCHWALLIYNVIIALHRAWLLVRFVIFANDN